MKKYVSLEDVYSNVGQKVAPIPRQSINEWTILAADEDAGPIKLGDVDDKFLKRLRKDIVNHQGGVKDLLHDLVNSGHWAAGMKHQDYTDKILLPAMEAFINIPDDIDANQLKGLLKNKKNLTGFKDQIMNAVENNDSFNYLDSLEEIASQAFQGNTRQLLDRLYALDFQQSNVNVGKGELVATLFSNAVKGKKGDLYIDGLGEVEVKGTQGRPGKGGGTVVAARKKLPQMLKDKGHNIYTGREIQKFLLNLTKSINELKGYISSLVGNPKFTERTQENLHRISDYVEQFTDPDNIKNLDNNVFYTNKLDLEKMIHGSGLPPTQVKTALSKLNQGSNSKPGLEKTFKEFQHSKDRKTITPGNEEDYHWSDVVKHYFLGDQWGLTKDDIVDGFVELANEEINSQEESQLREALNVIVDENLLSRLANKDKAALDTVVASIHSVLYHNNEGFPIMLLVNSTTKEALPLSFPGDNLKEKLLFHYDTIDNLISNGHLKIGLSVDPRSKGVQFTFTR